jgi:hypothetical protein
MSRVVVRIGKAEVKLPADLSEQDLRQAVRRFAAQPEIANGEELQEGVPMKKAGYFYAAFGPAAQLKLSWWYSLNGALRGIYGVAFVPRWRNGEKWDAEYTIERDSKFQAFWARQAGASAKSAATRNRVGPNAQLAIQRVMNDASVSLDVVTTKLLKAR